LTYRFTKPTILILVLSVMLLIGCTGNSAFTSESLSEITLSQDVDKQFRPVDATTVFSTDARMIFCSFTPSKAPAGAMITAQWIYAKGEEKDLIDYVIDQWTESIKDQSRIAMFIRRPTNGWPKGEYKVVLFVDSREEISIPFTIR
jgi:hypothetical protein